MYERSGSGAVSYTHLDVYKRQIKKKRDTKLVQVKYLHGFISFFYHE